MARGKHLSAFYRAYMKSPAWKARSRACILRAGGRCERCGKPPTDRNPLQAHHVSYDRLGAELPCDLKAVHRYGCHPKEDRERKRLAALRRKRFRG